MISDAELYNILTNDPEASKCLEDNNFGRLYNHIIKKYDYISPNELTSFLLNAGLDVAENGSLPTAAYMGDKTLKTHDFSGNKSIGRFAFKGTGLTAVDLRGVEEIGQGAFFKSDIEDITLKPGCKIGDGAFALTNIEVLYIPDGCSIGDGSFAGCNKLTTVVLDGTHIRFDGDKPFEYCRHINTVYFPMEIEYVAISKLLHSTNRDEKVEINVMVSPSSPLNEEEILDSINYYTHLSPDNITIREAE